MPKIIFQKWLNKIKMCANIISMDSVNLGQPAESNISKKYAKKNGCESEKCYLRHPKVCRYHREIGYCKFGEWCLFKHESNVNKKMEEAIKKLSLKLKNIKML